METETLLLPGNSLPRQSRSLAGYGRIRADQIPIVLKLRPTEALRRLVELYTEWEWPEGVARWQKELAASV